MGGGGEGEGLTAEGAEGVRRGRRDKEAFFSVALRENSLRPLRLLLPQLSFQPGRLPSTHFRRLVALHPVQDAGRQAQAGRIVPHRRPRGSEALDDLAVDVERFFGQLVSGVQITAAIIGPDDVLKVSESGLYTTDDLHRMNRAGYGCSLVGESLMRQADVAAATRALLAPADASSAA